VPEVEGRSRRHGRPLFARDDAAFAGLARLTVQVSLAIVSNFTPPLGLAANNSNLLDFSAS
jgi:hypothetical protein